MRNKRGPWRIAFSTVVIFQLATIAYGLGGIQYTDGLVVMQWAELLAVAGGALGFTLCTWLVFELAPRRRLYGSV